MTHSKLRAVVVGLGVGAQHAAAYKVPRHVLYLRADEWPVNTSGKVSKPDLRKMALARLAPAQPA